MTHLDHCSVIIVTHNSQSHIASCIQALQAQTVSPSIIIVDSGSKDSSYLIPYTNLPNVHVEFVKENIGFCRGNNLGLRYLPENTEYVLFLNPDAFLTPHFIQEAVGYMKQPHNSQVGALSGLLLGYDIHQQRPTGKVDSTGIFQKWYGKWYDRDQGVDTLRVHRQEQYVPALCGALMFCRKQALDGVQLSPYVVMDPAFYMYKEDIDLSLRLRKQQWKLLFLPQLLAYHCRGWQKDRAKVPHSLRLISAKNEIRLHLKSFSPYFFYSLIKYLSVKLFNL